MKQYDFLIIGAGIFGITAAIELSRRSYSVCVLNSDTIPHPLAASTDISKAVRIEYGTDEEYMDMAIDSIEGWREWNEVFDRPLYHETGYLVLSKDLLESDFESYAGASYVNLLKRGYHPERMNLQLLAAMFPAFNSEVYRDGFYNPVGGYVESGKVIEQLTSYAASIGVDIYPNHTVNAILKSNNTVTGVTTQEGSEISAGHVVVCAGNFTPYLLPELKSQMNVTGHPVFHLRPELTAPFTPPDFSVFAADIQNTGWYGFPYHPMAQVVKIANHGIGRSIDPIQDERVVSPEEEQQMRDFLKIHLPVLADAPLIYSRLCCYTDTLDGHFWIDQHPEIRRLTVASGGSGHGFKMGPVLGEMIADVAEEGRHKWSGRYSWRELTEETLPEEEARFHG